MSSNRIAITGATGGSAANRREINDLIKDEKQFSLYIQALRDIMSRPQSEFKSFFQVSAIHGLPHTVWDGAVGPDGVPSAGYCTHGSVLFPTWHRPYVALYEQLLHESAQRIASQYTSDKESWTHAADTLRQPYWDWALNAVLPPEVMSMDQVTITIPTKGRVSVDNPLRRYKFNPVDPSFSQASRDGRFKDWQTTLRHPSPPTGPNAKDGVATLQSTLERIQKTRTYTRDTFALLTQVHDWPAFSNTTPTEGGNANSLEAIHDNIHGDVGGNGHMGQVVIAAFDPVFWLHHANVDRILSLWAALNPGVWVTPGKQREETETIPACSKVDVDTPLTPFWNSNTTFWPSSTLTHTTPLAYTYPEFNGLDMSNPDAVGTAITLHVIRLYGNPLFGGSSSPFAALIKKLASVVPQAVGGLLGGLLGGNVSSANMWTWSARVQFKHMELGGSFSVLVFLGEPPADPKAWRTASTCVGAHYAFVNTAADRCANCQSRVEDVNEGFIHLNGALAAAALAAHSELGSFQPDVVKPYLTKGLHCRAQSADGTPVELKSLKVVVVANLLTLEIESGRGAALPKVGRTIEHHDITIHGLVGLVGLGGQGGQGGLLQGLTGLLGGT